MIKRSVCVILSLLIVLIIAGCENSASTMAPKCEHSYSEATCTEPAKCSLCGEESGWQLGHDFTNTTCTQDGACSRCGEVQVAFGHSWIEATCQSPKRCNTCNATEGSKGAHNFNDSKCTVCGKENTKILTVGSVKIEVPVTASLQCYSTRFNISIEKIDLNLNVWYSVECTANPSGYGLGFKYSLYDSEGYVIASDSTYATDLNKGEKARNQKFTIYADTPTSLQAGKTYKLKLSNG